MDDDSDDRYRATDELLLTTKQVRRRLDLTRPVPRAVLLECIDIASRAPVGGNKERNNWLIVEDPSLKAQIADLYRARAQKYFASTDRGMAASGNSRGQGVVEVPGRPPARGAGHGDSDAK